MGYILDFVFMKYKRQRIRFIVYVLGYTYFILRETKDNAHVLQYMYGLYFNSYLRETKRQQHI